MSATKAQLISYIDFTSLNASDDEAHIQAFCTQARTPLGKVAAVCLFPQFVSMAQTVLRAEAIPVATVANFPTGQETLTATLTTIEKALAAGADEIDVVLPYQAYLGGEANSSRNLLIAARQLCQGKILKAILETGAFSGHEKIYDYSLLALDAGVDFIKTSTGKIAVGATLEAATAMLKAIQAYHPQAGFKASGGIKTVAQAEAYHQLAEEMLGASWCQPQHFRIGASSLLANILDERCDDGY